MDIEHIRDDFGLDIFNGNSIDVAFAKACQRAFDAGCGRREKPTAQVRNKKTGSVYEVIEQKATDATNSRDGNFVVVYKNESGRVFVRDYEEFWNKFNLIGEDE